MAVWSVRLAHGIWQEAAPHEPNVEEQEDIDESLDVLPVNFQAAAAVNLAALQAFKHDPKESLHLYTRSNVIALSLENNFLVTSRSPALSLLQHLPALIKFKGQKRIETQDTLRLRREKPPTERKELMTMAREEELSVLWLRAEYRMAGMTPKPRAGAHQNTFFPFQDRLKYPSRMDERLGARVLEHEDTSECRTCRRVGNIAKVCPITINNNPGSHGNRMSEGNSRIRRVMGGN